MPASNSPGLLVGPYRILHRIGGGGIAEVFAAVHERTDQDVALKLLSQQTAQDPQIVARFVQEARALAQLRHSGIVRIFHCDKLDDGTVYLAMERLNGTTLRAWMARQQGSAALNAVLDIGRQIADAMVEVHARGIVHRDLKPENVILVPDATMPYGHRVKVLDFGVAKVPPLPDGPRLDTQVQTAAPVLLGTATYMAPEQCRSAAEVTDRADVYALGVVLFEMIAGQPPFVAAEPIDVISMHVRTEPPALHEVAQASPVALSTFISSMLAKAPAERPTMHRCRDMLGQAWSDEPRECPFPGLSPFNERQAELFFGRKEEIKEILALLDRVRAGDRRYLQIEGQRGVGKSSLVQAGVLPQMSGDPRDRLPWRIALLRPSGDPIRGLARAVAAAYADAAGSGETWKELEPALRASPEAFGSFMSRHVPRGGVLLLVIEQVEDLLALGATDVRQLDALLSSVLASQDCPVRLLTVLRSDFEHRLDRLPCLAGMLGDTALRYQVRPMGEEALTRVIHGMAARAGLRLSEGLPERMVRDATGTDSPLPLLGHVLRGLWSPRGGASLTHERYERIGGVTGALSRQAALLLGGLGEQGLERAKWITLALVQVGRGAPDTRRQRTRREVIAAAGGDALAEDVLMRLSGVRVSAPGEVTDHLRLIGPAGELPGLGPAQQRVELLHETLLRQVPIIAAWIDAERALLERHADLETAAQAWTQAGCPTDGLPSGSLLEHYGGRAGEARERELILRLSSDTARRFIEAAGRLERRRMRLRWALCGAAFLGVAGIVLTAVQASRAQQRAETNLQHIILATEQVVSDADWILARFPHTLDVRRKMLAHIEENLASLPKEEQGRIEVRRAVIQTRHRLSDLARLNESLARADELLVGALEDIQRELERWPAEQRLVDLLALNHSKRGKVALARGRWGDARQRFAAALALLERPAGQGGDKGYRRTLATSFSEQAELEIALGRADAAGMLLDRAVGLLEQNEGEYDRSLLALALAARGEAARKARDVAAAAGPVDRALAVQEPLVDADPGNAFYRWILARARFERAALWAEEGRADVALQGAASARTLAEALHQGEPTHKSYALVLGQILLLEEALAHAHGDRDRAEQARRRRCAVAGEAARRDEEDVRFQQLACR